MYKHLSPYPLGRGGGIKVVSSAAGDPCAAKQPGQARLGEDEDEDDCKRSSKAGSMCGAVR
jgi:hypothetical protein